MEEQMKEQFEQFQSGLTSVIENGSRTALRSNEAIIDSVGQLVNDQFEFGRSCLEIGRKQMESLAKDNDMTALFADQSVPADYYNAATKYGEALRKNAESTYERMVAIGREAGDAFTRAASA